MPEIFLTVLGQTRNESQKQKYLKFQFFKGKPPNELQIAKLKILINETLKK